MVTEERIRELLQVVKDPEIPTVSLVDLGVVHSIEIDAEKGVTVELIPTFSGCPAMSIMAMEVELVLKDAGIAPVVVRMNKHIPWHSNLITEQGIAGLKAHGLAPPPRYDAEGPDYTLAAAECPNCESIDTKLVNPFGPTLCRAIHHCNSCQETFEQFKPM